MLKITLKKLFWQIINNLFKIEYSDDNKYKIANIAGVKLKFKRKTFNYYRTAGDDKRIQNYLEYKKTRQAKGVVYTCTTNDYDDINEIKIYKYIDKDWDYVFFTDNEEHIKQGQIGIWEVRPLQFSELDNTRNQRWHKINAHIILPEYEKSIWIDANINILTNRLFKLIERCTSLVFLPKHFKNICIYEEYKDVEELMYDESLLINNELKVLKENNMPKHFGFSETNILYREHNNKIIISMMNDWWQFIKNYSKRDQLSFMYLVWKYSFDPQKITFPNARIDKKNFFMMLHKKEKVLVKN